MYRNNCCSINFITEFQGLGNNILYIYIFLSIFDENEWENSIGTQIFLYDTVC